MRHLILLMLTALLATGCVSKTMSHSPKVGKSETTREILSSEYAYVLAGYSGVPASVWVHISSRYDSRRIDNLEKVTFTSNILQGVEYHLYRIIPGKYTLVDFYDPGPLKSYTMTTDAKINNELIKSTDSLIGSFTAEKGRITYIGTMHHTFDVSKQRYNFTIANRDYEAEAFLAQNYPKINSKQAMVFVPAKRGWFIR